jgi:hypothetical protein
VTTPRYFQYKDRKSVPHTPNTILSRGKINFPRTLILVVEGPDDKIALQGIVDEKGCDVEFLEGKQKVFECLKQVNEQKRENIVGLVDSDYEKILKEAGSPPPSSIMKYLFSTDSHDMNTMVVASSAYLRMILSSHPNVESETQKLEQIREYAVAITQQLGLVRCLNADRTHSERFNFREDLRLDPPHIRQYIDIPHKKAKIEELLTVVKKDLPLVKRQELCQFITEKYAEEIKARYLKEDLPWQLCQGHDLFSVLYTLLQEGNYVGSDFDEFSAMLFDCFGMEELKESGKMLHQKIKDWEKRAMREEKPYRILKTPN